jgi:peptidoglycan hydrolase CwlO-like protein
MSFDLRGALLAAAEEAGKMKEEFQQQIDDLTNHINYVDNENARLREKLNKAANLMKQFAEILFDDQNY